ncbi:toxin-antitoxin system YwqK family antitoxin [Oceanivirga salmonicida]|uniref:hypothetical protein n=1 Tax=Oceanivirga salmonicida TaxID=1769291 RepID=UPI000832658D|nr:hypothetical protein [Oceanivirga salmonicida]
MKKIFSIFCLLSVVIAYGEPKYMPQDYSGVIKTVFLEPNTKEEVKVINGRKEGESKEIYPDGRILYSTYKNGVRQGKAKIEYPNGNIEITNIKNDYLHGDTITTSANAEYEVKGKYIYKYKDGDFITRNKSGKIVEKITYILDEATRMETNYDNDIVEAVFNPFFGTFKIKILNGNSEYEFKYFNEKYANEFGNRFGQLKITHLGNVYTQTIIKNKPITMAKVVYKNGEIKYAKKIKDLLPDEIKDNYNFDAEYKGEDKKMTKSFEIDGLKGQIKDGKIDGILEYHDKMTSNKIVMNFKDGKLDGEVSVYTSEKGVYSKTNIKNDKLHGKYIENFDEFRVEKIFENGRLVECLFYENNVETKKYEVTDEGILIMSSNHFSIHEGDTLKIYYKPVPYGEDEKIMVIVTKKNGQVRMYKKLSEYQGGGSYIELKEADKK